MAEAVAQHQQAVTQAQGQQGGQGLSVESPQGELIAQLEALADGSPRGVRQRHLAAKISASPGIVAQRHVVEGIHNSPSLTAQRKTLPNNTGLPDNLKSGIESLSGMSMDSVKVHYNSGKPAELNALAYAQGSDIHLAPGQERHLPHEAWHVVQQAQGRVKPTRQMKRGALINDDTGLEREADVMGARAMQMVSAHDTSGDTLKAAASGIGNVAQRLMGFEFETHWDLRGPADIDWNSDTPLVRGLNWIMSPDEIAGRQAKIEFKTLPFNVDGTDDHAILGPIVDTFESIGHYIRNNLLTLPRGVYTGVRAMLPGIQVQPNGPMEAKPQVTGGVRTDLVLSFLKDMASRGNATDLMPGASKKTKLGAVLDHVGAEVDERSKDSREYWGGVALLANLVKRFQADKTAADAEFDTWRAETTADLQRQYDAWVVRHTPDAEAQEAKKVEVRAHFAQKSREKTEEIRARRAPSYAKARASALPRVAFNKLPQVKLRNLPRDVLQAAGLNSATDGALRMFPLGMRGNANFPETIAQWIGSIQQDIPVGQQGRLWSARDLGTGPVGPSAEGGIGIPFELRALKGRLPHTRWFEFALPFTKYFADLNKRKR